MYTQHEISEEEHRAWWERIRHSENDLVFIVKDGDVALGVLSFYQIHRHSGTAFWAFYGVPGMPKGAGARIEFLALEYCFSDLGMRKLNCEVLERNPKVIEMHQNFGFQVEGIFRKHILLGGQYDDVYRLAMFAENWHLRRAFSLERILARLNQG